MNQILQTENKKNNGPIEIGKIVKFFAIAIIIFAFAIIGVGSYNLISNNSNSNIDNQQQIAEIPEVNITKKDDDLLIEINSNIAISNIIYNWNEEEEYTIYANNNKNISETIGLPYGTNTLVLKVIDINGKENVFQKEYIVDGDKKPVIELSLTTDNKIKIVVQDDVGLKNISYLWNEGDKTTIEVNEENSNKIEELIEIPLGQNTLKVEALNIEDIASSKELEVKGIKKPVLSFKKEGDYLVIRAEDEIGMKIVDYTLNGQKYQINYGNKKVIEYRQLLQKGENNMDITAENQDGGKVTKKVKIIN